MEAPINMPSCHDAAFYSDDRGLLRDLAQFIGKALNAENSAIVVATEIHRGQLLQSLQAHGVDVELAIRQGRYTCLDAASMLSSILVHGRPNPIQFVRSFSELILTAARAAKTHQPRVSIFGECAPLLWAQGNPEAAIQMEKLANELTKSYDVDILCGYSIDFLEGRMSGLIFQRICAEHTAVVFR